MAIDHTSHLTARPIDGESRRNQSLCKSIVHFICSNLGLMLVVVGYCVGGAFLFILLEQYQELQNCEQGSLQENVSVENISESVYNYVTLTNQTTDDMYLTIESYLASFTSDIYDRRSNYRYTGQDCATTTIWTFPSTLLFTITIVTTIGYGHITPVSWEGQITCICYALIGIPIFLVCLTNISAILGDIFRFLYASLLRCCCCVCRIYSRSRRGRGSKKRTRKSNVSNKIECVGIPAGDPTWPETLEDNVSGDEEEDDQRQKNNHHLDENDDEYDDDDDDQDDAWSRIESRVPTGLVIVVIVGYHAVGTILFHQSEGWTMIQAVYFCYITLSTIGFGDLVPGITSSSTSGLRFLAACLYILFGLAILAMSIDLLKESMVDKIRWLGSKIGFISDDEDQVDNDFTQYANFEYAQQSNPNTARIVSPSQVLESPPAYESPSNDGQWLSYVRDKPESTNYPRIQSKSSF